MPAPETGLAASKRRQPLSSRHCCIAKSLYHHRPRQVHPVGYPAKVIRQRPAWQGNVSNQVVLFSDRWFNFSVILIFPRHSNFPVIPAKAGIYALQWTPAFRRSNGSTPKPPERKHYPCATGSGRSAGSGAGARNRHLVTFAAERMSPLLGADKLAGMFLALDPCHWTPVSGGGVAKVAAGFSSRRRICR